MAINQNSQQDLFIYNFPSDFVPQEIEDKYKIHLDNFHKPYPNILNYLNSTIKDVNIPALTFPTVEQTKFYGKSKDYRGSGSPYDVYNREITISLKSVDFHISYIIMQDIMLYHYIKNGKPFLEDFKIQLLDEERRVHFEIVMSQLVPLAQSDIRLAYNEKSSDEQVYTLTFKFNRVDIEYIPYYGTDNEDGEIFDEYSDKIIKNTDFINLSKDENINDITYINGTSNLI